MNTLMVVLDQGVFGSVAPSKGIAERKQNYGLEQDFQEGDGIKPVIAYLAVNLHECML